MKRKYSLLIGLVAVMILLILIGRQAGFLATTSGSDGTVFSCNGKLYTSPAYSVDYFQNVADSCMDKTNVVCDAGEWSSTENYFMCQQICYMCEGEQAFVYVENMCSGDGIPLDHDDMVSYYIEGSLTDAQISQKYCAPPPPEPDMVTCYQCDGETLETQQFEDSCGAGWSLIKPTCSSIPPTTTTCYMCNHVTNELITQTVPGSTCPDTYSTTKPNCNVEETEYYQCVGGEINIESFATQPSGWKVYDASNKPNCSTFVVWFKGLIDFEEKPVESGFLIGAVLLLLISIFFTVKDLTSDETPKRGF